MQRSPHPLLLIFQDRPINQSQELACSIPWPCSSPRAVSAHQAPCLVLLVLLACYSPAGPSRVMSSNVCAKVFASKRCAQQVAASTSPLHLEASGKTGDVQSYCRLPTRLTLAYLSGRPERCLAGLRLDCPVVALQWHLLPGGRGHSDACRIWPGQHIPGWCLTSQSDMLRDWPYREHPVAAVQPPIRLQGIVSTDELVWA
jgi:hypothetical protein